MTRKEKTQQNRFDTKIAPLLKELGKLCKKYDMPMLMAVQLFEDEEGARVSTTTSHPDSMSLPMTLSSSLMNGTTQVRIAENNMLQFIIPKGEMPEELRPYARATREPVPHEYAKDELEPLVEHATHCEDCNTLMQEAILRGERVDNIVVPKHDEAGLMELLEGIKKAKLPFIIPKNNIIH